MKKHSKLVEIYAAMFNSLDASQLEKDLADDFCYSSQMVFEEITGKKSYLNYINQKLKTIQESNSVIYAELGIVNDSSEPNCLILAQGNSNNLVATLLIESSQGVIKRADMCIIPSPKSVIRTGIYPKIDS